MAGLLWAPDLSWEPHFDLLRMRIADAVNSGIGIGVPKGQVLYLAARYGPAEGRIVEIGSAFGRSACYMAEGSKMAGREHVWSIDPHEEYDSWEPFLENIRTLGLGDWIHPMLGTSEQAWSVWDGEPIRLLFIDGDHSYDSVKLDIECWAPLVVEDGIIMFDDYRNMQSVRILVDEFVKQCGFEIMTAGDLIWV